MNKIIKHLAMSAMVIMVSSPVYANTLPVQEHLNKVLNIDYRTINEDTFKGFNNLTEQINDYIKYIKDNKIVTKAKVEMLNGDEAHVEFMVLQQGDRGRGAFKIFGDNTDSTIFKTKKDYNSVIDINKTTIASQIKDEIKID